MSLAPLRRWLGPFRRPARPRRFGVEVLEDRTTPAFLPLGLGLSLDGNFQGNQVTSGPVWVGFTPIGNEPFRNLLEIDLNPGGVVQLDQGAGTFTVTSGAIDLVATDKLKPTIYRTPDATTPVSFSAAALLGTGGQTFTTTTAQPVMVAGAVFTLGTLYLDNPPPPPDSPPTTADSVVKLKGKLGFAGVDARIFTLEVDGANHVTASAQQLSLNGAQMTVSLPGGASLFGLGLVSAGFTAGYTHDARGHVFTIGGNVGFYAAKLQAENDPDNARGIEAQFGITITDGAVTAVNGAVTANALFRADTVQFQAKGVQLAYDFGAGPTPAQFELSGDLSVYVQSPNNPSQPQGIELRLGTSPPSPDEPGLVIRGGTLEALTAYVRADFELFGLTFATTDRLAFNYVRAAGTTPGKFTMSGGVGVSWGTANPVTISAELLGGSTPGLVLQDGKLQSINLVVSGGFSFGLPGGLNVARGTAGQAVNVVWTTRNGQDAFGIAGQFNLTSIFDASVSLGTVGGPYGITVVGGEFDLSSVTIEVQSINLGAFQIQDLKVKYTQNQSAGWTLGLHLQLLFPGGWGVGGELTLVNGAVDSIEIDYAAKLGEDGIPLGDSGLFLTFADLSVQNLQSTTLPVTVGGDVAVAFGPQVSLPDPKNPTNAPRYGLITAQGSFAVSGEELAVRGGVYLGAYVTSTDRDTGKPTYAGLLGSGTGYVNLDWAARVYSAGLDYQMLDGAFQVTANFEFKGGGGDYFLFIDAEADLAIPKFVPVVGGLELASADFLLDYEDDDGKPVGFVAGWVDVVGEVVGVKYDIGADKWSVFGKAEAAALHDCETDPEDCLIVQDNSFVYHNSFAAPPGATTLVMSADLPEIAGTQSLAVDIPGVGLIPQANWADPQYAQYGITLVPIALADPTKRQVSLVGHTGQPYTPLPAGDYELQLVSSVEFNTRPAFTAGFGYPKPTVDPPAAVNDPTNGNKVIVTVTGQVDPAFVDRVTARLFIQPADGGPLTPMPATLLLPPPAAARGAAGGGTPFTITAEIDLTDRFFQAYAVYAAVSDGVNEPVYSAASPNTVSSAAPLNGIVTNAAPGHVNQHVSGIRVYVDADGDGVYDAGADPSGVSDTGGGYTVSIAAGLLTPNQTYTVRLDLPAGTTQHSPVPDPTYTYTPGGTGVSIPFEVVLSAGVNGFVFEDLNKDGTYDTGDGALPGQKVYVDLDNNGRFDPTDPYTVSLTQGDYHIYGLAPNPSGPAHVVRVEVPPAYYAPVRSDFSGVVLGAPYDQFLNADIGLLPKVRISGTVTGYPLDPSGVLSPTAEDLSSWTVNLLQNGQVVATTQTDSGGNYQFVVEDGTYTVAQGLQPGWRQLAPFKPDLQINPSGQVSPLPWQPDPTTATADLDGDGFLDLVIDRVGYDTTRNVHVLWGDGSGSFSLDDSTTLSPGNNQNVILADTSGSGRPDVLLWDNSGDVFRFQNQGGRNFAGAAQFASIYDQFNNPSDTDFGAYDVTAGDLDGDGRDDVVVLWYKDYHPAFHSYEYGFSIFYADGTDNGPNFVDGLTPPIQGDKGNAGTQGQGLVEVVDLRNTGVNDLVFAGYFSSGNRTNITVGLNDGTGKTFAWQTGTAPAATNLAFNDIDGDGFPDVVFLNAGGPATTLSYLHNQYVPATGTSPATVTFVPFSGSQPALVLPYGGGGNVYNLNTFLTDMNGDLRPDVVAVGQVGNPRNNYIWVWTNNGGGAYFTANPQANPDYGVPNTTFSTAAVGDLDGNGLNDVVLADTANSIVIVFTNLSSINPVATVVVKPATAVTQDFVNGQIGQLTGAVYEDVNRNGTREAGDRPMAGVRVFVDRNNSGGLDPGEPVATTGADGAYAFAGLPAGTYPVRVIPPQGNLAGAAGDANTATVGPGRPPTGLDFPLPRRWLKPVADVTAARGSSVAFTVDQTGAATNPRLRFLLDAGAPAGAALDPLTGRFTWTAPTTPGRYTFTARLHDAFDPVMTEAATFDVVVLGARPGPAGPLPPFDFSPEPVPPSAPKLPTAPDFAAFPVPADRPAVFTAVAGFGGWVRVFDYAAGAERFRFRPFGAFAGEVRVAVADVTGDGIPDVIAAAGPGGGPHVMVFDGNSGAVVASFFAFDPASTGGVSVAAGDVNRDGFADVVVSQDAGGGVAVFDGRTRGPLARFRPFEPGFAGGVRVAVGDTNRDGAADLVVTAADGGGPRVAVFDGATIASGKPARLVADFFVMDPGLRTGFYATVGDINGDGWGDIIVGAGRGGGPRAVAIDGKTLVETGAAVVVADVFAGDAGDRAGARLKAVDFDGDGRAELLAAAGPGAFPVAYLFDPTTGRRRDAFYAFPVTALDGIEVG